MQAPHLVRWVFCVRDFGHVVCSRRSLLDIPMPIWPSSVSSLSHSKDLQPFNMAHLSVTHFLIVHRRAFQETAIKFPTLSDARKRLQIILLFDRNVIILFIFVFWYRWMSIRCSHIFLINYSSIKLFYWFRTDCKLSKSFFRSI